MIGRRLYGARKVYKELRREQARGEHLELGHVPRCQVERLMRANGLVGVRRGKAVKTGASQRRPVEPEQYCAIRYTERLANAGAVASIGTVGDRSITP